jgi:cellulose synthase/poly-beta-1,6-N-acetylglucosamine synthase-like glycosyltransferase
VTPISYLLAAAALVLALPVALFLVEVVAAMVPRDRGSVVAIGKGGSRQRIAVLVPAHNESTGLLPTLSDIKAQMNPTDRVVVVADNCSDDTATIAIGAGVEVVERRDLDRKGKGYALAHGLDYISADPPDIVIVIDADCRLADHTIGALAATCTSMHRPAQALDLMLAPPDAAINLKVAEFAWRVKNHMRPLGLKALGLPCQLMGTGMAFPWDLIRSVDLANGSIVEDLKLGHDLALGGYPPVFCPSAKVTSVFPSSAIAATRQRLRWEQGHIGLILTTAPRLFLKAVTRGNVALLTLALDLSVPPLSLLAVLVVAATLLSALATVLGLSSSALLISATSLTALAIAVCLCWVRCGRDILPLGALGSIGFYALGKLSLYAQIFSRKPGPQWIRTDRKGP